MAAAATTAATAIYKYTYTLGRSLYVPITSRCNSIPLPATRGPGFVLPRAVADALIRVRNAEVPGTVRSDLYDDWLDDEPVDLPPYNFPLVSGLYDFGSGGLEGYLEQQRQMAAEAESRVDGEGHVMDDTLEPSIATLVNEVSSRLDQNLDFDSVVIAGEGEPTLRMDALLAVARSVEPYRKTKNTDDSKRTQKQQPSLPVRVITNGLCYGIPNLGYSPFNRERNGGLIPMHRHVILRDMMEAGISRLSVALNTANRHEYDLLMEPCCHTGGGRIGSSSNSRNKDNRDNNNEATLMPGTAHDIVCELILEAGKVGMDVELTGVDRPGIDKVETERLARLLLSVGPKNRRRSGVRWRRYFD